MPGAAANGTHRHLHALGGPADRVRPLNSVARAPLRRRAYGCDHLCIRRQSPSSSGLLLCSSACSAAHAAPFPRALSPSVRRLRICTRALRESQPWICMPSAASDATCQRRWPHTSHPKPHRIPTWLLLCSSACSAAHAAPFPRALSPSVRRLRICTRALRESQPWICMPSVRMSVHYQSSSEEIAVCVTLGKPALCSVT